MKPNGLSSNATRNLMVGQVILMNNHLQADCSVTFGLYDFHFYEDHSPFMRIVSFPCFLYGFLFGRILNTQPLKWREYQLVISGHAGLTCYFELMGGFIRFIVNLYKTS